MATPERVVYPGMLHGGRPARALPGGAVDHLAGFMVSADTSHGFSLCLSKDGDARFLSHLDFGRLIERALRRSGLPVRFTEGFNPRIKLSFAEALPVGIASTGEWITVLLHEDLPPDDVRARLASVLPEGVRIVAARRGGPPPEEAVVRYRLEVVSGERSAAQALTALLVHDEYLLQDPRRDALVDVRAHVADGSVRDGHVLVELVAAHGRPPRPGPVARALRELAEEEGVQAPAFGVLTKLGAAERRPGDDTWPDAASPPGAASSSSMPSSPRRAASRSSRVVSSMSTT